jgi:citrate lyase subunit beta/citryl-CoA lyase
LYRSYLYAPGSSEELIDHALTAGADAVVLDLEAAAAPADKDRARELVAWSIGRGGPAVFVRVNGFETGLLKQDVRAVLKPGLAGIRLPKATPDAVRAVAAIVPEGVAIECAIETAAGVLDARAIAAADRRVTALTFGAAEFSLDVGSDLTPGGRESFHARSQIVLASRAAGIGPPVDSIYRWLDDPEGLAASAHEARLLGFGGKSATHASQLPAIHAAFTPSAADVDAARRVLAGWDESGAGGGRLDDGTVLDAPFVERARRTLALAERSAS